MLPKLKVLLCDFRAKKECVFCWLLEKRGESKNDRGDKGGQEDKTKQNQTKT